MCMVFFLLSANVCGDNPIYNYGTIYIEDICPSIPSSELVTPPAQQT
jgi:hypothetical protein